MASSGQCPSVVTYQLYNNAGTLMWNGNSITTSGASIGTSQITGILSVPQRGTGDGSLTAHGLLVGNGTNPVNVTAVGTTGSVLIGQGGSADPIFSTAPTLYGALTTLQGIGTSSTEGIVLSNTATATSSVQQWSPRIHFSGQGYKSNATAASQSVDVIEELETVKGTSAPSGNLVWSSSIAGGGYSPRMTLTSGGNVGIGTTAPQSALAVNGGVAIGTTYAGTNAAGSNNLIVQGNVGMVRQHQPMHWKLTAAPQHPAI